MSSGTDYLGLKDRKIFENVRETLPKEMTKARNLMAVRDDVLYTWDFQDNCVLALNIKAARGPSGDTITHQTLLPMSAPYFAPENLIVNISNTLLIAYGSNGILVFELPQRSPPYGLFAGGKEMIYCRSYSLHERSLAFSTRVEVRQVRFHPGSPNDCHVAFATTENILRIYNITDGTALLDGVYYVGSMPKGNMPSSKISYLEGYGETVIDFDFGPPEPGLVLQQTTTSCLNSSATNLFTTHVEQRNLHSSFAALKVTAKNGNSPTEMTDQRKRVEGLNWPIYILHSNGHLFTMTVILGDKTHPGLFGPHLVEPSIGLGPFRSLLCIPSTPPVLAISNCKGKIFHILALPEQRGQTHPSLTRGTEESYDREPYHSGIEKTFVVLETMGVELGLNTSHMEKEYTCPIYLHRDLSKLGNYFATHDTGVHSISVPCVDVLHKFLNCDQEDDVLQEIIQEGSTAEYLLCTKISTTEDLNPVIGFSIYHEPHSILVLLGNGQFVSLAVVTMPLSQQDYFDDNNVISMTSPLKQMLTSPFDAQIQRILKKSNHPILKLSNEGNQTQQECYELLQRATQVFRDEHFKQHDRAREEIEKRVKALKMLKKYQQSEIARMMNEKQALQDGAEYLAEKYEDLKDKQEELIKRCQAMLIAISKSQTTPSHAEKEYHGTLLNVEKKIDRYSICIDKLKQKMKYQEMQLQNYQDQSRKNMGLGSAQAESIKANLKDMTKKIVELVNDVNDYKQHLIIQ